MDVSFHSACNGLLQIQFPFEFLFCFTVQQRKMIRNPLHMLNQWERLDRGPGPMQTEKHMGNVGHIRLNFYFGFMRGDVLYLQPANPHQR